MEMKVALKTKGDGQAKKWTFDVSIAEAATLFSLISLIFFTLKTIFIYLFIRFFSFISFLNFPVAI